MNKKPKRSVFTVSALFLVFILFTVPAQAFSQSSGLSLSRPLLAEPEIDVQGNGTSIISGDTTPDTADDTDFGTAEMYGDPVSHTFTIYNSGDVELNLTGTPLVAITGDIYDFTVTDPPTTPVPASGTTTFTVTFSPLAIDTRRAVITILNDDIDEGTYTFNIQGTGDKPPEPFTKFTPVDGSVNQPTSLTLSWMTATGATSYEYCYDNSNDGMCDGTWTSTGAETSAEISGLSYGAIYYWQVRAINEWGTTYANGSSDAYWRFDTGTLPGAFSKSSPANGAVNQLTSLTLSWGASTGATGYAYCYATTTGCTSWVSVGTATSVGISTLSYGTTYYWQVRASNTLGDTLADGGAYWSFTVGTLPGTFSKSSPADGAVNQLTSLTLSWGTSAGATGYAYCYATTTGCTSWVSVGTATSAATGTLAYGTTYYWQVRASNALGDTLADGGTYWSFTVGTLPGAFSKSSPANGAVNQPISLTLSWETSAGATGYAYCYATTTGCTGWVSVGTATSVDISPLAYGTTYYWQVRASNALGDTLADGGTYWSFTVGTLPGAFSKSSPADGAVNQMTSVTLIWGTSAGATGYAYCYATTTGCTGWVNVGTATSVGISTLAYGTTYYWQVRASNALGDTLADGGTYWSFTVGTLPGAFSKSSPANGVVNQLTSLTLSWETSAGATGYAYCYATTPGCTGWVNVGTATSVGISTLSYGATYYWQVRASNTLGDTLADGGTYWSFTVGTLPGAFSKVSPADGAVNQLTSLTLSWGASSGATSYEYCYDNIDDDACSGTWTSTGTVPSAAISGLLPATSYYWQVRANNSMGTTYANSLPTAFWGFTTVFPEMDVKGNGISIPDNDDTPIPEDGTNFGSVAVLNAVALHTFTIYNTGAGDLILSGTQRVAVSGPNAADFTVNVQPASVIPPGGSSNFTVVFNPSAAGTRDATLSIANNDSNENPYNFDITGTGVAAPEIEVRGNTLLILDGDSAPSIYDGTDFVALPVASGSVSHTFTIYNVGDANLNLTGNPRVALGGANLTDFSVSVQPASMVAPGDSTTFTVVFDPTASGTRSAELSILNNDTNESPYNFSIQGTGVNPPGAFNRLLPANGATEIPTSPMLSWSASTEVGYYEYCYDTTPDNACTTWINNGTATSVGLSGLSSVTTYYWHVRAVNIAGTTYAGGSATTFWSFTTTWAVSPDFYKNTPLDNAIDQPVDLTLSWGVSAGASSYEYCIDTSDDDACTNWINVGDVTSVALTGLREETTYFWQVRANNSGQVIYAGGSATAFWSFTTGDFFVQTYLPVVRKT